MARAENVKKCVRSSNFAFFSSIKRRKSSFTRAVAPSV
jgi:hypothetical protein